MTESRERGLTGGELTHDPKTHNPNLVVFKIGTDVVWGNGSVVEEKMDHLTSQFCEVFDSGGQVIVIASGVDVRGKQAVEGAIREGRLEAVEGILDDPQRAHNELDEHRDIQDLYGQTELMYNYYDAIRDLDRRAVCLVVGGSRVGKWRQRLDIQTKPGIVLLNGSNVRLRGHRLINNDLVGELVTTRFTNAGNMGLITPTGGVLDEEDNIIPWIDADKHFRNKSVRSVAKSVNGTGGMRDKVNVARRVGRTGVRVSITGLGIPGTNERPLVDFFNGQPVPTYVSTENPHLK